MAKIKLTAQEQILKAFPDMKISGSGTITVCNPFSGREAELTPEGYALYWKVKISEASYNRNPSKGYRDFRKSLDLFRKLYPSEYMTLLD